MNFSFKKPEDSPGFLLWQLTNQWQRQQREALSKLSLTHPQFVILAGLLWLSNTSKLPITQKILSDFTKIDKMTTSDLVATLCSKKYMQRTTHQQDKRAYTLELTAKGQQKVLAAIPIVEGIDAKFFSKATPGLQQLNIILNKKFA
jgi:DNA-binding MarR family transcriptional regulator